MTETIILKLLDILPHWMIIAGVILFVIHKICSNQIKYITKIVGKYLIKNNNTLDKINKRLDNIESNISELKKNDKEQNEYINLFLNSKK